MIGVISHKAERATVYEFFELFKTPWEFYQKNRSYDVVLTSGNYVGNTSAKLLVIYGSKKTEFDSEHDFNMKCVHKNQVLVHNGQHFPVYGNTLTFGDTGEPLVKTKVTGDNAAITVSKKGQRILRLGYDLFHEISFLLTSGQPAEYAHIPTLEIHIALLRNWIVGSGIPLLEIPPIPKGYDFAVCLTHDVDFVGLRNHKFDHTMFGFVYRALLGSLADLANGRTSWKKLIRNWKAVLSLPGVYLGIVHDFWVEFDHYMEIEKDLCSTFFFLPYKNWPGKDKMGKAHKRRASRYDIEDVKQHIHDLKAHGCEIGLHGIDAWMDSGKATEESNRISSVAGSPDIGVRMHWLYFDGHSPKLLEKAGFLYDTTLGYNDAVGYWGGTTQSFRPLSVDKLLELPLHIQDTALFYPDRMGLREDQGFDLCKTLIENVSIYGGVLVINWHHRSLAPERCWGDFYVRLLECMKRNRVWFGTCSQIVGWFQKRREVEFESVMFTDKGLKLRLAGPEDYSDPGLSLRVFKPTAGEFRPSHFSATPKKFTDIPYACNMEIEVSL